MEHSAFAAFGFREVGFSEPQRTPRGPPDEPGRGKAINSYVKSLSPVPGTSGSGGDVVHVALAKPPAGS